MNNIVCHLVKGSLVLALSILPLTDILSQTEEVSDFTEDLVVDKEYVLEHDQREVEGIWNIIDSSGNNYYCFRAGFLNPATTLEILGKEIELSKGEREYIARRDTSGDVKVVEINLQDVTFLKGHEGKLYYMAIHREVNAWETRDLFVIDFDQEEQILLDNVSQFSYNFDLKGDTILYSDNTASYFGIISPNNALNIIDTAYVDSLSEIANQVILDDQIVILERTYDDAVAISGYRMLKANHRMDVFDTIELNYYHDTNSVNEFIYNTYKVFKLNNNRFRIFEIETKSRYPEISHYLKDSIYEYSSKTTYLDTIVHEGLSELGTRKFTSKQGYSNFENAIVSDSNQTYVFNRVDLTLTKGEYSYPFVYEGEKIDVTLYQNDVKLNKDSILIDSYSPFKELVVNGFKKVNKNTLMFYEFEGNELPDLFEQFTQLHKDYGIAVFDQNHELIRRVPIVTDGEHEVNYKVSTKEQGTCELGITLSNVSTFQFGDSTLVDSDKHRSGFFLLRLDENANIRNVDSIWMDSISLDSYNFREADENGIHIYDRQDQQPSWGTPFKMEHLLLDGVRKKYEINILKPVFGSFYHYRGYLEGQIVYYECSYDVGNEVNFSIDNHEYNLQVDNENQRGISINLETQEAQWYHDKYTSFKRRTFYSGEMSSKKYIVSHADGTNITYLDSINNDTPLFSCDSKFDIVGFTSEGNVQYAGVVEEGDQIVAHGKQFQFDLASSAYVTFEDSILTHVMAVPDSFSTKNSSPWTHLDIWPGEVVHLHSEDNVSLWDANYNKYLYFLSIPFVDGLESTFKVNLSVFPNPVSDIVNISGDLKPNDLVLIQDINGQKVYVKSVVNTGRFEMNTTDLSAGTYLISVTRGNRRIGSKKVIVRH